MFDLKEARAVKQSKLLYPSLSEQEKEEQVKDTQSDKHTDTEKASLETAMTKCKIEWQWEVEIDGRKKRVGERTRDGVGGEKRQKSNSQLNKPKKSARSG